MINDNENKTKIGKQRYGTNKPRVRHGRKCPKYKTCLYTKILYREFYIICLLSIMMVVCIKQYLKFNS